MPLDLFLAYLQIQVVSVTAFLLDQLAAGLLVVVELLAVDQAAVQFVVPPMFSC